MFRDVLGGRCVQACFKEGIGGNSTATSAWSKLHLFLNSFIFYAREQSESVAYF